MVSTRFAFCTFRGPGSSSASFSVMAAHHQKSVWDWKRRPPKPKIDMARRNAAADWGCIRRTVLVKEGEESGAWGERATGGRGEEGSLERGGGSETEEGGRGVGMEGGVGVRGWATRVD